MTRKTDGGKSDRIPGANTPASLSAYEHGYAGIKWGDGTDEQPATHVRTPEGGALELASVGNIVDDYLAGDRSPEDQRRMNEELTALGYSAEVTPLGVRWRK